jgi:hypothetical protein
VPRLLGTGWALFVDYPYLLPSIIAGSSGLVAFALGLALVPEVCIVFTNTVVLDAVQGCDSSTRGLCDGDRYAA